MANNASFQTTLQAIQKDQDKIASLIEGLEKEIPQQSMRDYFVKLQIIIKESQDKNYGNYEDISGEKKEAELQDIFNYPSANGKPANKLLILGGAGVGKSTLMQYIAFKWGSGELWNDRFDYVYRINLKTLLSNDWKHYYTRDELEDDILKCLVHRSLVMRITSDKIKKPKLQEMYWPEEDNSRVLLLLDGFDEVAHLKDNSMSPIGADYQELEKNIMRYKYLIFTSRPNAVDVEMRKQFDITIENTGLDNTGIDQYFSLYFKGQDASKGEELRQFLAEKAVIRDICKIPVNIAMLCYIWLTAQSKDKLKEISSVSGLYKAMLDHLSKRYIAKEWNDQQKSLKSALNNGKMILNEFKVLYHVAYMGMTGGGVANNSTGAETLIIKGAVFKDGDFDSEDEQGISIQSSINHLATQGAIPDDQRGKTSIESVYKFGLLKSEGAVSALKEDTDLHQQSFSFIHLTFQEYLTAYYLKEQLKNPKVSDKEKREICQFIAEHRNEPRYLMMLKFMAGIVTQDQSAEADNTVHMFWNAITCNVDSVIELGVETKISLIMHLLQQAKTKNVIDPRIPNKEEAVLLIDAVILADPFRWKSHLKQSDYMTDNIKEGLMRTLTEDNLEWCHAKVAQISELYKELSPLQKVIKNIIRIKTTSNSGGEQILKPKPGSITGFALDMALELINKLNTDEQTKILKRINDIVMDPQNEEYILRSRALQKLPQVLKQISFTREYLMDIVSKVVVLLLRNSISDEATRTILEVIKLVKNSEDFEEISNKVKTIKTHKDYELIKMDKDKRDQCKKNITQTLSAINIASNNDKWIFAKITRYLGKLVGYDGPRWENNYRHQLQVLIKELKEKEQAKRVLKFFMDQLFGTDLYIQISYRNLRYMFIDQPKEIKVEASEQIFPYFSHKDPIARGKIVCIFSDFYSVFPSKVCAQFASYLEDDSLSVRTRTFKTIISTFNMYSLSALGKSSSKMLLPVVISYILRNNDLLLSPDGKDARLIFILAEAIAGTQAIMRTVYKLLREYEKCKQDGIKVEEFIELLYITDTDHGINTALNKIIDLISAPDNKMKQYALELIAEQLIKECKDKTLRVLLREQIINIFATEDDQLKKVAVLSLYKTTMLFEKEDVPEILSKIVPFLNDDEDDVKCAVLFGIKTLVLQVTDNRLKAELFEKLVPFLTLTEGKYESSVIQYARDVIVSMSDLGLSKKSVNLLLSQVDSEENKDQRSAIFECIPPLVLTAHDKTLTTQVLDKLLISFDSDRGWVLFCIAEIIEGNKDQYLAQKAIKHLTIKSARDFLCLQVEISDGRHDYYEYLFRILRVADDEQMTNKICNPIIDLLSTQLDDKERSIVRFALGFMISIGSNKQIVDRVVDTALASKDFYFQSTVFHDIFSEGFSSDNIIKFLQFPYEKIKDHVKLNTRVRFQDILGKFDAMEGILKDKNLLNIEAIDKKLFEGRMDSSIQKQLEAYLSPKENHSTDIIQKIRDILIPKFYPRAGIKSHELIQLALALIGHEEESDSQKENVEVARKMINLQMDYIDDESLEWINRNIEALASLSKESKLFIQKLYKRLLEDSQISRLEEDLIIKFINHGVTTSINKNGEVIFEGRRYKIINDDVVQLLEKIAKSVINQNQDVLALQYKEHRPVFPKTTESGMKKAAADVTELYSLIEKTQELSGDAWFWTKLVKNGSKEAFLLLLEQRSAIGDHLVYYQQTNGSKEYKLLRMNPMDDDYQKQLEEIFGRYVPRQRYQGTIISVKPELVTKFFSENMKNLQNLFKEDEIITTSEYFQQELLCIGNTDRMDYLTQELDSKLTDYTKSLSNKLKGKVSPDVESKLMEYHKAFLGTFATVYTAAQVITSGQVQLNSGNSKAKMLATLASFAPFGGDALSNIINSAGEFLKSREMIINARQMKKLASDAVELNQLVGAAAEKIILNKKKQKMISEVTEEQLQNAPQNFMEKITQFIGKVQENIDQFLYTKEFDTAAAKLGNHDANELIDSWIKGKVATNASNATKQQTFVAIATGENTKVEAEKISSPEVVSAERTACCAMF